MGCPSAGDRVVLTPGSPYRNPVRRHRGRAEPGRPVEARGLLLDEVRLPPPFEPRHPSHEPGAWSLEPDPGVCAGGAVRHMDEDTVRSLVGDDPAVALQGQDPSGA